MSLAVASGTAVAGDGRFVSANAIRVRVPPGWHQLGPTPSSIVEPRTLLVVGTAGVGWDLTSACQIASYRIPARGAVVVVVGWKHLALSGSRRTTGRAPLRKLVRVSRPSFECYSGRGAAAGLVLDGRAYQVNVMVGDRASKARVNEAFAVARSFDVTR